MAGNHKHLVHRYLNSTDGNTFHSVIELGVDVVADLREAASENITDEQFSEITRALAEIRSESARHALETWCRQPYSPRWLAAATALFHNDAGLAMTRLKEFAASDSDAERIEKQPLIDDLEDLFFSFPMVTTLSVVLESPPEYKRPIAEITLGDRYIAAITQERAEGVFDLETPGPDIPGDIVQHRVDLKDFLNAVDFACRKLREHIH